MHRWRFQQVEPCLNFPLGVKTCYRAYASDFVVEFKIEETQKCLTPLGQLTGLEAFLCASRWYPQPTDLEGRDCEGFYLLINIPTARIEVATFENFEDFYNSMFATDRCVHARFVEFSCFPTAVCVF